MIKSALAKIRRAPLLALLMGSGLILAVVTLLPAAAGDTAADSELGQVDFSHSTVDFVRAQGFALSANSPAPGIAIDPFAGCVYVSDQSNNRVLGWRNLDSLQNGDAADFVIGQQDFYSDQANPGGESNLTLSGPAGLAVDQAGNLYVADTGNQRVTEYTSPCTQPPGSFFSAALTINVINPWGVATDANGDLFVTDTKDSKVLVYDSPLTSLQTPDWIIGQNSLTGNSCNQGLAAPTANTLCTPYGVATDPFFGTLYVADTGNNRVVAFIPTSPGVFGNNPAAAIVLGQHTFLTNNSGCGPNATNATSLCAPRGVTVDSSRNLYIADTNNNRVTEYTDPPKYTGAPPEPASLFFGQSNKQSNSAPNGGETVSANGLWSPAGVATDGSNLWVLDNHNYRALEFNETSPSPSNITPDLELGQFDFVHSTANFIDGAAYSNMSSVVIDRSSNPQHLYVVDSKNNRVLGYNDATSFKNGAAADLVIGQPDPYTTICNSNNLATSAPSALTLCLSSNPNGDAEGGAAAVDSKGDLWVSDTGNSRILEFPTPFTFSGTNDGVIAGEPATVVLGQPNADTPRSGSGCPAASQTNLCEPAGLAFDSNDNLYVADFGLQGYNRVVEFDNPGVGTNDQQIHLVLGQGPNGNSYSTSSCNLGLSAPSADSLCEPMAVAVDQNNNVYVADFGNNRVLEYDAPLPGTGGTPTTPGSADDVTADLVFGQGSTGGTSEFTTSTCGNGASGQGAITPNSLCNPAGVTVDPFNSVYIADQANNRILGFEESNPPAIVTPGIVFGQINYTSGSANQGGTISVSSLNLAVLSGQQDGLATDTAGDLFAVDAGNIRLLDYNGGFLNAPPTPTSSGSPTATPTDTATPTTTPTPTVTPSPVDDSLTINPKTLTFPKELFIGLNGMTSPVKKVTLKVPKKGPAITVVDMVAKPPFAVDPATTTCQANAEIAAGAKCEIGLTYTPTQVGKQNGAMTIVNNTKALHKIPIVLTGTGKMGKLKLKPAKTVSFAKTTVGSISPSVTVTLTNDNAIPMPISGISTDSGEFVLSDPNDCSAKNVAPQSSCAVTLTFAPSASGKRTGTLTIGEPAPNPAQTLKLKGTGQ